MSATIDITFSMESDANGRDPDQHSPTLRRWHQLLWDKPLPYGNRFNLNTEGPYTYLRHDTLDGPMYLASDAITHSYRNSYANRIGEVMSAVDAELVQSVYSAGCTIGAYTIFPGDVRDSRPTINGARGMHPRIADRFDLTLECIRRHYEGQESPLGDALNRYVDFFSLFRDFDGYVEFFHFQDLVDDGGNVAFYLPFDDFVSSPLPLSVNEYSTYAAGVLKFVHGRNERIRVWAAGHIVE